MNDPVVAPLDKIYQKDPAIVARKIAGEMILVPIRKHVGDLESIYLLNETALLAWELFDGTHTLADILRQMTQVFDVDEQQASQDLLDLVTHLTRVGALVKA